MSRNTAFAPRQHMCYPLRDVIAVELETRTDSEGGTNFAVRAVFKNGKCIVVSDQRRDADRLARFLGVERQNTKL